MGSTTTIKAIAFATNWADSAAASATYTIIVGKATLSLAGQGPSVMRIGFRRDDIRGPVCDGGMRQQVSDAGIQVIRAAQVGEVVRSGGG